MSEISDIRGFIDGFHLGDTIPHMEQDLTLCIGYEQRIGELTNQAKTDYKTKYLESLKSLSNLDDETETTRKAKLEAWTAPEEQVWQDFKLLGRSLKAIRMSLWQGIKTRREEPI